MIIRIEEIKLNLEEDEKKLTQKIAEILELDRQDVSNFSLVKKAIDSRNKNKILFVYSVDVKIEKDKLFIQKLENPSGDFQLKKDKHKIREHIPFVYKLEENIISTKDKPVIVGSGPAGLFCALILASAGLKPIILERGKDVESRVKDVEAFFNKGDLNLNSNVQFGEGGAGTFSDGKLYTLVNDNRSKYIFDEFVSAGAPKDIIWNANPHIGTDNLRNVVKNIRKKIENLGGEIRFNSCLTDIEIKNGEVVSIVVNKKEVIAVNNIILALGHSARDTYEMLFEKEIVMTPKIFSMGVRIEHKSEMINKAQYGKFFSHPKLPTARYKLVSHFPNNRSVYTFCMCPGGYVVSASSEKNRLVVNGMSEYAQDNENSNSALLVNVFPTDFSSNHPLAGIYFQREWEEKAYNLGGGRYTAPAQLVGNFINSKNSPEFKKVFPSYRPGVKLTDLSKCLPIFVSESLKMALPILDKKIKGFASPDAILTGIETRSSSPIRIFRDENFESNIKGIYPIGEGAGYAGGITSSAIDGIKVAELLIKKVK